MEYSKGRFPEKSSCSFGFCPNYLDPPIIWTTCTSSFERQFAKIIWAGVSPSLLIPKLTQYIQFVKSGQKTWAEPSPP